MIQMSCNVDRNEDPWRASRTVRLFGYVRIYVARMPLLINDTRKHRNTRPPLEPSVDSNPIRQSPACTSAIPEYVCALLLLLALPTPLSALRDPYPRLRHIVSLFVVFFSPSQRSHCFWDLFCVLFLRASCVS